MGDIERLKYEKEYELRGIEKERDRCAEIVQMARAGEIDTDFRTIVHFIEGGMTVDQIKKLSGN